MFVSFHWVDLPFTFTSFYRSSLPRFAVHVYPVLPFTHAPSLFIVSGRDGWRQEKSPRGGRREGTSLLRRYKRGCPARLSIRVARSVSKTRPTQIKRPDSTPVKGRGPVLRVLAAVVVTGPAVTHNPVSLGSPSPHALLCVRPRKLKVS